MRKQGHGTRLMQAVEREARLRYCVQIVLETHDFQAPEFYRRLGFDVAGIVEEYPRGHRSFVLVKSLRQQTWSQPSSGYYDTVWATCDSAVLTGWVRMKHAVPAMSGILGRGLWARLTGASRCCGAASNLGFGGLDARSLGPGISRALFIVSGRIRLEGALARKMLSWRASRRSVRSGRRAGRQGRPSKQRWPGPTRSRELSRLSW